MIAGTFVAILLLFGGWLAAGGCLTVPDQSRFEQLKILAKSQQAVVRVYGAPIPYIGKIAIHTWLVTKPAHRTTFQRWEVWQTAADPYYHVRLDLMDSTSDVGAGGTFVIAELVGVAAEHIVEFVENNGPHYPCREEYVYFPGPNSNSFVKWMLQQTNWDIDLSSAAVGTECRNKFE